MLQSLVVILTTLVLGKAVLTLWGSYKGQVLPAVGEPGRKLGPFPQPECEQGSLQIGVRISQDKSTVMRLVSEQTKNTTQGQVW